MGHRIKVENVCTKVKNARCGVHTQPAPVGVPVVLPGTIGRTLGYGYGKREADPQVLLPSVMPYHNCVNTHTEVCYPLQSVEETTITEKSCTLRAEVKCQEVVVATIPRVTCDH